MELSKTIKRVRDFIGDQAEPFRTSVMGDGQTDWYDLPKMHVVPADFTVIIIDGSTITTLEADVDYTLDSFNGEITLAVPVPYGQIILVTGTSYSLIGDEDITDFIEEAVVQHTHSAMITERYRDKNGFINYRDTPVDLENLPLIEEPLIPMLAAIEILWMLSTDASLNADIVTAEGTHIQAGQIWSQMRNQIEVLTEKYKDLCQQLNVGLHKMEVFNLRKRGWRTGRYAPIFTTREYDDYSHPSRVLPPIGHAMEDESGVPNPFRGGYGYGN